MSENSYQVLFLNLTSGSGAFNDRRLLGRRRTVTVSPRERLPTVRGRQTQAAIDAAARAVVARKGFLATTVVDIAAGAGKSAAHSSVRVAGIEHAQQDDYCPDDDPKLTALALFSMLVDDEAGPT
jgi:hypothetical protein